MTKAVQYLVYDDYSGSSYDDLMFDVEYSGFPSPVIVTPYTDVDDAIEPAFHVILPYVTSKAKDDAYAYLMPGEIVVWTKTHMILYSLDGEETRYRIVPKDAP